MSGRAILPNHLLPFLRHIKSHKLRYVFHNDLECTKEPLRIGVCVSGGPDSMALAYLLSKLHRQDTSIQYLSALIVDHKARPESTDEALQVQRNLTTIGVESTILTMQWPANINPLNLSDFESQARIKRYQLLARSALTQNIRHLFLGHHQDDQIETILMRLIRDEGMSLRGLAGMASSSSVPCEFDVFGVHTGQERLLVPARPLILPFTQRPRLADNAKKSKGLTRMSIPGGLQLQRPMLAFTKADLVATCQYNNVPYVVDPTNKDPTSCLRNAMRHLRGHYTLPRALGTSSILQLKEAAQQYLSRVAQIGEAVLSRCKIRCFDLRSGVLKVYIPQGIYKDEDERSGYEYAIAKLTEMVTPNVRVNHATRVPQHVTSRFCVLDPKSAHRTASPSFVHDNVLFKPEQSERETWTLSRQPMRSAEVTGNIRGFKITDDNQSQELLWDNRYWVKLENISAENIGHFKIRALCKTDIASLLGRTRTGIIENDLNDIGSVSLEAQRWLQGQLRSAAPGKVRFTLPVITFKDKLIALPTLDYYLPHVLCRLGLERLECIVSYNSFSLLDSPQSQLLQKLMVEG